MIALALLAAVAAPVADLAVGQTLACAPKGVVAVVGRLDPDGRNGASIASVSIFDQRPGAGMGVLSHIPVDAQVLKASCPRTTAAHLPAPGFESGYADWRKAFEAGQGGYFTIPVSEILDVVKKMTAEAGAH